MSENKHYGRQIIVSLFLTVFLLLAILYLASRYLLPLYEINQEMIYGILVKLFPVLIGLVMIEIGVLIARRRDEDYADQVDKLPPNAYDKPLYTLPMDDPSHRHSDQLAFTQQVVTETAPIIEESVPIVEEKIEVKPIKKFDPIPTVKVEEPSVVPAVPEAVVPAPAMMEDALIEPMENSTIKLYKTDFQSILNIELENAKDQDYDLSLVMIAVIEGPVNQIANKLMMQSAELAYSYLLENGRISMILPFYNDEEARSFTRTLIEGCKKEFAGSSLQIGFASRNGRMIESDQLVHEAEAACTAEQD